MIYLSDSFENKKFIFPKSMTEAVGLLDITLWKDCVLFMHLNEETKQWEATEKSEKWNKTLTELCKELPVDVIKETATWDKPYKYEPVTRSMVKLFNSGMIDKEWMQKWLKAGIKHFPMAASTWKYYFK